MAKYLTRAKLHADVWQRPIGYLARELGINSAKLRAACKAMSIPVPGQAYWADVRAGTAAPPPDLAEHDGPDRFAIDAGVREPLVDWVTRSMPAPPKPKAPPLKPIAPPGGPRYVTLKEWATLLFGEHAPHQNTLLRWVHEGRIQPQPKKMGRHWWVEPRAEYVSD